MLQDLGHPVRKNVGDYLTCAFEGRSDAIDAIGLNTYCYCANGLPFEESCYKGINDDYGHYDKPLLFTEFGCRDGRHFDQVTVIVWHGAWTHKGHR